MKRILLLGLFLGQLAACTGCGLFDSMCYTRPYAGRYGCSDCDGGGCPTCGVARRGYVAPRRAAVYADGDQGCADCGRVVRRPAYGGCDSCSDPCGEPCGGTGRCWHRGPLSCVFALIVDGFHCGACSGCGERYWGDFYSDPPDCWDPCDGYGNYTGGGCSTCGGGTSAGNVATRGYSTGCKTCGGGGSGGGSARPRSYSGAQAGDIVEISPEKVVDDRVVGSSTSKSAVPHKAVRKPQQQQ